MKLLSTIADGLNSITAYGPGYIAVNGRSLTRSFLLTPERMVENWGPDSTDALSEESMLAITALDCPIVLLGTGLRQRFPAPVLLRPLMERGIGVEVMDSFAACRTYSILIAEGRTVAAALIVERAE